MKVSLPIACIARGDEVSQHEMDEDEAWEIRVREESLARKRGVETSAVMTVVASRGQQIPNMLYLLL